MNRYRWVLLAASAAAGVAAASIGFAGSPHAASAQPFISYACAGGSADGTTIATDLSSLQTGGTLLLSGTCGSSSTPIHITVRSGVTLEGTEGADNNVGTQIDGTVQETDGETVTLHGLQIDCNGAAETGLTVDGWNVSVNYVTVSNCENGLELDNPTNGTGNHVNDWIDHVFMQGHSTGYGLYVNDNGNGVTDGHISDSFFSGYQVGIYMTNAAGWYVTDNHVYGESREAIYANRMWGTTIRGNYIESWTGQGILGTVQAGAVASVVAENNVFQNDAGTVGSGGTAGHGIELDANGSPSFVTVTGNNVIGNDSTDSGSTGLYYSGTGAARSLTVASTGNQVSGFHTKVLAVHGAS